VALSRGDRRGIGALPFAKGRSVVLADARSRFLATLCVQGCGIKLSSARGGRVTFLLRGQEKSNPKRRPPRLALAGLRATAPALPQLGHPCPRHARQVREPGSGFSTAHPCAGEKESTSCRLPLRGLSTPTHRRTGAPGRAAGHRGPHSWRSLRERKATSSGPLASGSALTSPSSLLTSHIALIQGEAHPADIVTTYRANPAVHQLLRVFHG